MLGVAERRGPAKEAELLYEETAESIAAREAVAAERRLGPAAGASTPAAGRPSATAAGSTRPGRGGPPER